MPGLRVVDHLHPLVTVHARNVAAALLAGAAYGVLLWTGPNAVVALAAAGLPGVVAGTVASRGRGRELARDRSVAARIAWVVGGATLVGHALTASALGGWPPTVAAIVEVVFALGFPRLMLVGEADEPRCQRCERWLEVVLEGLTLAGPTPEQRRAIVDGRLAEGLASLDRATPASHAIADGAAEALLAAAGTGAGGRFVTVEGLRCPTCDRTTFLDVAEVRRAWVNGRRTDDVTPLFRGYVADEAVDGLTEQLAVWRHPSV